MGSCCQLKSGRVWNAAQSMQFLRCFDADKDEHPVRWLLVQMPVSCKFMLSRLGIKS